MEHQQAAARALLALSDRMYLGQAIQVVASDPRIAAACRAELLAAARSAVERVAAPATFEIGWQAARAALVRRDAVAR